MAEPYGRVVVGPLLSAQNSNLLMAYPHVLVGAGAILAVQGEARHTINPWQYPCVDTGSCTVTHEKKTPQTQWTVIHGKSFWSAHPASDTVPSPPFTNNTLTTDDIPGLLQQVCRALLEDHHTLQSIRGHSTSPQQVSYLSHTYIVGYYRIIAQCISTNTCVVSFNSEA